MNKMPIPSFPARQVYDACVNEETDQGKSQRYKAFLPFFLEQEFLYMTRAEAHELYQFNACAHGNPSQVVLGSLKKIELVDLYDNRMAGGRGLGRAYYEKILTSTPHGKCPYCGFGQVTTLDHYLSKARYPEFSVLPANLVPACSVCNSKKGSSVVEEDTEISHPYFEANEIEDDVWLFAHIDEDSPIVITYRMQAPENWPENLARRVGNYFRDFGLARRYSIEAGSELVSISSFVRRLVRREERTEYLKNYAESERGLCANSWKAALYEALSLSDWYVDSGFLSE